MARRITAVLLLLAASSASAQGTTTTTLQVTESNDSDRIINIAECTAAESDNLFFRWTYAGWSSIVTGTYRLTISDQSGCPSSAKLDVYNNIDASASSGAYPSNANPNISVPQLLSRLAIACTSSSTAIYVCVDFIPTSNATVTSVTTGTVTLDISWSAGAGSSDTNTTGTSNSYDVVVTNAADPTDTRTNATSATTYRVGGLRNGVTYNVTVYAYSPGSNKSDASNVVQGVPVEVRDFWRLYREASGKEMGGCSTGTAGAIALVVLAPLALWRRRRS